MKSKKPELVCPAGTPASLCAAVDAGADVVYLGFRDETNARNFPGLNFSREEFQAGLTYAHERNAEVYVAINTYPEAGNAGPWHTAVDDAASMGADAVILADIGLLDYASTRYPDLRLHLSVQASASNPAAIAFYVEAFGVKRVVLPRVLSVAEIAALNAGINVESEVFVFGGLCVMAEGRCALSSYVTGESPNMNGVCSPASHVRYDDEGDRLVSRLGDFTINAFTPDENAGYPTLCKGRFRAEDSVSYLFEGPTSLNAADVLPQLVDAGVSALKIEGRQRGKAYVSTVVSSFRRAIDALDAGAQIPALDLAAVMEGQQQTTALTTKLGDRIPDMKKTELTMGPVLFNWKPDVWRDFYFRIADEAPVDTVCIGEVVCSKREPFLAPHIPAVVDRLQAAGKEVVFSSLSLVMSKRDLRIIQDVVDMDGVLIEANDVSALSLLQGKPHAVGPFVNVYNEGTLAYLTRNGAVRVTLPVEMSLKTISCLKTAMVDGPDLEVFAYGRLPLAISARCYHARAHGLSKDGCQYVCDRDPDGMEVDTLDRQPFLSVNGVQTLSRTCVNLLGGLSDLVETGVHRFRLSPHSWDMVAVARVFRAALDGDMDSAEGVEALAEQTPDIGFSNGYLYGQQGINYYAGGSTG